MQVDSSTAAGSLLAPAGSHSHHHRVQAVFSDVLEAVGRAGYASAQEVEGDQPLSENVVGAWNQWFATERAARYSQAEAPEQLRQEYGQLLLQAHQSGGYAAPKDFLQSLSGEQLEVVQNVQHLADPIDVGSLTEEGALNLLLPPAAQVDLNHDGITQSGAANGLRFPDSNTPLEVVQAWEEATAGMTFGERMMAEFRMVAPTMLSNMVVDENGAYSHHYEPGDPEWRNPRAEPGYSYVQAAQDWLDHLDFVRPWISREQYEEQTAFWTNFKGLLEDHGAK